jgi:hypothetical protein
LHGVDPLILLNPPGSSTITLKPLCDFDWTWPKRCDRSAFEALMALDFLKDATNAILVGPNGVGKSTLARNIARQALIHGHTVLFTSAGQLLGELAALDSDSEQAHRGEAKRHEKRHQLIGTKPTGCRPERTRAAPQGEPQGLRENARAFLGRYLVGLGRREPCRPAPARARARDESSARPLRHPRAAAGKESRRPVREGRPTRVRAQRRGPPARTCRSRGGSQQFDEL